MKPYALYLLDLDGTVYRGSQAVPHAGPAVTELLRRGALVRYLTNNSAARPAQVSSILNHMGVPCRSEWVHTTGGLAAAHCSSRGCRSVYLVGEEALRQTLSDAGVTTAESAVDAVVVGICRSLTYAMIERAADLVRGGVPFVATNRDATYPLEGGRLQPGAGAMVAAVEVASGVVPTVLGKPMPDLALAAAGQAGIPVGETLLVGDRMDTDIACGRVAGCDTFLVLTGVEQTVPPGQAGGPDLRSLL